MASASTAWKRCLVEGNLIGTNAAGTAAVANSGDGIFAQRPGATIGGTSSEAGERDLRQRARRRRCRLLGAWSRATGSAPTRRVASPVPNQGIGVYLPGRSVQQYDPERPPSATSSRSTAVLALRRAPGTTGTTIQFNAIFGNGGPGIDLNDDGVTPNTPNGANNTPVLTSAAGGIISGTLNASPNSTYIVDFYVNLTE